MFVPCAVIFMNRRKETRTRVLLPGPNSKSFRMTGNARGVAHQKRNLKRCELNDPIGFMIVDLRLLIEKSPKIKIISDQKTKNII
jgi:hypothetical protein